MNPRHGHPNQYTYSRSQSYSSSSQSPSTNQGVLTWLDAIAAQEHGWDPRIYSDPVNPSQYQQYAQLQPPQNPQPLHYSQQLHSAQYSQPIPMTRSNTYPPPFQQGSSTYQPQVAAQYQYPPYVGSEDNDGYSSTSSPAPSDTGSPGSSRAKSAIALDPSQPLTVDGKPRERVYVACDRCRVRKLRCDGAKPSCINCQRVAETGVECHYDPVPKRRGQDKAPRTRSAVGIRQPRKPAVRKGSLEDGASHHLA